MLFLHVRLVFATYAAIVDNQPGVQAVRISFGIAHRRSRMVVAAFVGSVLVEGPVIGPIYLLIQANLQSLCRWRLHLDADHADASRSPLRRCTKSTKIIGPPPRLPGVTGTPNLPAFKCCDVK